MKKTLLILSLILCGGKMMAENYTVKSPDENIVVNVETGAITTYSVSFKGQVVLSPSPISMTFDNGTVIGRNMKVTDVDYLSEDKTLTPVIRQTRPL